MLQIEETLALVAALLACGQCTVRDVRQAPHDYITGAMLSSYNLTNTGHVVDVHFCVRTLQRLLRLACDGASSQLTACTHGNPPIV